MLIFMHQLPALTKALVELQGAACSRENSGQIVKMAYWLGALLHSLPLRTVTRGASVLGVKHRPFGYIMGPGAICCFQSAWRVGRKEHHKPQAASAFRVPRRGPRVPADDRIRPSRLGVRGRQ